MGPAAGKECRFRPITPWITSRLLKISTTDTYSIFYKNLSKDIILHISLFVNYLLDDSDFFLEPIGQFNSVTKVFSFKYLEKRKVIYDSQIPQTHHSKVSFHWTHDVPGTFLVSGRIKELAAFRRDFTIQVLPLLELKMKGDHCYDTEKGLEFWIDSLITFLSKNYFGGLDLIYWFQFSSLSRKNSTFSFSEIEKFPIFAEKRTEEVPSKKTTNPKYGKNIED